MLSTLVFTVVFGRIVGVDTQGVPHIAGNRVTLRVRLAQLGGASSFRWNCAAFGEETGFSSDGARSFGVAWTPPPAGTPLRVVVEPALSLARGRTTATPKVSAWDVNGKPVG
ncbi:MAG: hypothetical protein HGA42_16350, partial [Nostocales cyanobacterium W4_Combined_metabat2_030]|nr:hypothetical protein [Nostocales cyanobacterium W4_Combined_metabat2_030]